MTRTMWALERACVWRGRTGLWTGVRAGEHRGRTFSTWSLAMSYALNHADGRAS